MKIIKRVKYLDMLKRLKDTPDIKVVTGMRRSGKSLLIQTYIKEIASEDKMANIIFIDMQDISNEKLLDYHALHDYALKEYKKGMNNYLFIDEVQLCKHFERAVNSLHSKNIYDIYLTGSNAFLLSSDLATLFTGRTMEIEVFPFSFEEYIEYFAFDDVDEAFVKFVEMGGMAGSYLYTNEMDRNKYLQNIYQTVLSRDIIARYQIRDRFLLQKIGDFMMSNISNLTSYRKVSNTLTTNIEKTNHKTIGEYVNHMVDAFMLYKVKRYDVQGKSYLQSGEKYYLTDHAFRSAMLGKKETDYGRVYENIVAIELIRRGYEVYVGKLKEKEVDFVAIKRNEKIYFQVAADISMKQTLDRELAPFFSIRDNYPKILLSNTKRPMVLNEGFKIIDIARWLLGDEN